MASIQEVKEVVEKTLDLLGVQGEIEVTEQEEVINVLINTDDTGLLIGRHGETISSLELILNQIINRDATEWQRIVLDTGGYKQKQEDMLRDMAKNAADRVKETGNPYSLYDLTPSQRRVVHMILSEDPQIITESEGEGRSRHLVVRLRS